MRNRVRSARKAVIAAVFVLLLVGIVGWSGLNAESAASGSAASGSADRERVQQPLGPALVPALGSTAIPRPIELIEGEAFVVSAREGGRSHIWAHLPGNPTPHQLTSGDWDDIDPVVSPSQDSLAFASNRNGNWDLYLLDLQRNEIRQLTVTLGYEGKPTWSPDGLWLAYEAYYSNSLDIWILPIDGSQSPIQLTDHRAADLSPAWDPGGRRIAFVSDREGELDIFIADLDRPTDRFANLTNSPKLAEGGPVFSPDGAAIAYGVQIQGVNGIQQLALNTQDPVPQWIGQGSEPAWIPGRVAISGILRTPYTDHIVTYPLEEVFPSASGALTGRISELHWSPLIVLPATEQEEAGGTPLFEVVFDEPRAEGERLALVPLQGIQPGGLMLSDAVDEAFEALRTRVAVEVGWDFLGSLEHAFVGINDPLPPGYAYNDWLYTGRAFASAQAAVQAGWVEVVREDFGLETYWRVFVRTYAQDGSMGRPLRSRPWDFNARFSGNPPAYDAGGAAKEQMPVGYYVDFTALAADYGFERLAGLTNWRSFYPGARFDEFAFRESLDWVSAMEELYPRAAISTPTPYQTPTQTPTKTPRPTPTPWWWRWRTPTPTIASSQTPSP
jgi:TolB protein